MCHTLPFKLRFLLLTSFTLLTIFGTPLYTTIHSKNKRPHPIHCIRVTQQPSLDDQIKSYSRLNFATHIFMVRMLHIERIEQGIHNINDVYGTESIYYFDLFDLLKIMSNFTNSITY